MKRAIAHVATAAALLVPGACAKPPKLAVDHAWVRLAANPDAPAAAYFILHGGGTGDTLTGVSTDEALKTEMHETMAMGAAMTTMTPLSRLALPANGETAFRPGGRHVMLFAVNRGVRPGGAMVLTFAFASGARLTERAQVIAAGDPAPQ